MNVLAASGPSAYWYLARGTGVVSLLLLTASVVLGVLGPLRVAVPPRWPRFAIDTLHRDVSLLVLAVLVVHIVTSVLDAFAPITLLDGVIPFLSPYRPLWLGLGAVGFDLLVALAITSIVRRRLGYRAWRAVHWLAYASWPIALLHGLGTGTDAKLWWNLLITAACAVAVAVAVMVRIARAAREHDGLRGAAVALTLGTPLGVAAFALAGPLQPGWARRAGTPASLLGGGAAASARTASARARGVQPPPTPAASLKPPFTATLSGTVTERRAAGGAIVNLAMRLSGGPSGQLRARIGGVPLDNGGLQMTGSQVDLAAQGLPAVLEGQIVSLEGEQFDAHVRGGGAALDLQVQLDIHPDNSVTGSLQASATR